MAAGLSKWQSLYLAATAIAIFLSDRQPIAQSRDPPCQLRVYFGATKTPSWGILRINFAAPNRKMKILVLTKRQYMGKDLLDDRFGRFWELPFELMRLGHDVRGIALSYQRRPKAKLADIEGLSDIGATWSSINLLTGYLPQIERYTRRALRIAREFCPDIIWIGSDAYHAVFGSWLAK